ncbi:MAG TPA: beta-propeller fold lactonase family protein [Steroidobacteraceae bacterium]|jgi:6-phosphogluconolactonase (cycloisomerase 2 family)|nr:beta-propeller fold lactonase family protein [Steroidobacteraceae bacterium]
MTIIPDTYRRRVYLTCCASLALAGCNGFNGYTFDGTNGGSSGGGSSGSAGTSSSGGTDAGNTLGGTVSGLAAGSTGFAIQDGLGHTLLITAGNNDPFVFPQTVSPGVTYDVTVQTQPDAPAQLCRVSHATGVMPVAAVANIAIKCVTPGRYLFAAVPFDTTSGTGSVAAFTIDPISGELTAVPGSPYATAQSQPSDIAIDPTGRYLYTPNSGSDNISTDLIGTGGALTLDVSVAATGAAPGAANANSPLSVTVVPDGTYLYVGSAVNGANGAIESYALNGGVLSPALGTLAASTFTAGNVPRSLATAAASLPTKALLFAGNVHDGTIEDWLVGTDGALTDAPGSPLALQSSGGTSAPYAVAIYPGNNFLYVTDSQGGTVSVYDYYAFGNQLALIASYSTATLFGQSPQGLAIDPTGSFLYVSGSGYVTAFTIDATTGLLSPVGFFQTTGVTSTNTPTAVRVDPSSQFVYVSNGDAGTISVFEIDFATGALMPVGRPAQARISNGGPSSMAIE